MTASQNNTSHNDSQMKTCTKCGERKPLDAFWNDKKTRDGKKHQCIVCAKEYMAQYRKDHEEEISEYAKNYNETHKEEKAEYWQEYYAKHKDRLNNDPARVERRKAYYQEQKDRIREREKGRRESQKLYRVINCLVCGREITVVGFKQKICDRKECKEKRSKEVKRQYYKNHSGRIKKRSSDWRKKYPERNRANIDRWSQENPDKVQESKRQAKAKRRQLEADAPFDPNTPTRRECWESQFERCALCAKKISFENSHYDHRISVNDGGGYTPDNMWVLCDKCNLSKGSKSIYF